MQRLSKGDGPDYAVSGFIRRLLDPNLYCSSEDPITVQDVGLTSHGNATVIGYEVGSLFAARDPVGHG